MIAPRLYLLAALRLVQEGKLSLDTDVDQALTSC
jgi:hypothetical protein